MACNSNIRIYRYAVGQRFGKHIDESVDDENGLTSQWTVLIYLNGEGEGSGAAAAGASGSKKKGRSDGGGAFAGAGEEGAPLRGGETVFYKVGRRCGGAQFGVLPRCGVDVVTWIFVSEGVLPLCVVRTRCGFWTYSGIERRDGRFNRLGSPPSALGVRCSYLLALFALFKYQYVDIY